MPPFRFHSYQDRRAFYGSAGKEVYQRNRSGNQSGYQEASYSGAVYQTCHLFLLWNNVFILKLLIAALLGHGRFKRKLLGYAQLHAPCILH